MKKWLWRITVLCLTAAVLCLAAGCGSRDTETLPVDTEAPQNTPAETTAPVETVPPIRIGDIEVAADAAELELQTGAADSAALTEALASLTELKSLSLPETGLTAAELAALAEAYPDVAISYTVKVLDQVVESTETKLDLSALQPAQVAETAAALEKLPELAQVELMNAADESPLSLADVKEIQRSAPGALVHYALDFYGQRVFTTDETVEYDGVAVGQENVQDVRDLLDVLQCCTYFKLADAGIDNETMAELRDAYPNTKIVWRVYFGEYFHCLTDEESIRAIFDLDDTNCENLKYCTDVKYMDIGHDTSLHDVSFVAYMPKLEICIVSGAPVYDISAFGNCPELEWLELVWCGNVSDLSCLENCPKLAYLNICYTQVTDLTPLDNCPLERFMYYVPKVNAEQRQAFIDRHPDCWTNFDGENPYVLGWRYNDQGYTWCDMYLKVREVFRYSENYYNHS